MNFQVTSLNRNIKTLFLKDMAGHSIVCEKTTCAFLEKKNFPRHRISKFNISQVDARMHSGKATDRSTL